MNLLKKFARLSFFVLTLFYASLAHAWSKSGHEAITFTAFTMLSEAERAYYTELATLLFRSKGSNNKGDNDASGDVVKLGSFPDTIRDKPLSDVFRLYGESVPKLLLGFSDKTTARWHYHNVVVKNRLNHHCEFTNQGVLLDRLIILDAALKSPLSKRQEALLLSFQIHLIQDIHQPLHTLTKLGPECKHDLGGNRTCIVENRSGRCKLNLHRYWDSGLGVFDTPQVPMFTISHNNVGSTKFLPEQWMSENSALYEDIYQLENPRYQEVSKVLIQKRVWISVKRLTDYLKAHYKYVLKS